MRVYNEREEYVTVSKISSKKLQSSIASIVRGGFL